MARVATDISAENLSKLVVGCQNGCKYGMPYLSVEQVITIAKANSAFCDFVMACANVVARRVEPFNDPNMAVVHALQNNSNLEALYDGHTEDSF